MQLRARLDRKQFLTLTLGSTSALVLGCGAEAVDEPIGGAGTNAGGTSAGSTGTAGTFSSSGNASGGTGTAGTFGSSGSGGSSAGASGSGGAGGSAPVVPDCSTKLRVMITANHNHVMAVTLAEVMAGVAKTYDTTGTSGHPHWIQLTAADFTKLQAGQVVRKLSCNDEHEHEYIISCTGLEPDQTSMIAERCLNDRHCAETADKLCAELP